MVGHFVDIPDFTSSYELERGAFGIDERHLEQPLMVGGAKPSQEPKSWSTWGPGPTAGTECFMGQ